MSGLQGFDQGYQRWRASEVHAALLGDGFPSAVQPFSFVPIHGLELVATELAATPGQRLVDLGCGRGGPGLWLAQHGGLNLLGVDASGVAIADARERRHLFEGVPAARFQIADVTNTGLPAACADVVVSIDVLQLVEHPSAMLQEAARLLKPAGRIALTTWEGRDPAPPRFPRNLTALLEAAGLVIDSITEHPDWLQRQLEIYERAALADTGADPAISDLADEGRRWKLWHHAARRILAVAHT